MKTPSHACEGTEPAFPVPSPSREFSTRGQVPRAAGRRTPAFIRLTPRPRGASDRPAGRRGWLSVCLSPPSTLSALTPLPSLLGRGPAAPTAGRGRREKRRNSADIHAGEGRPHSPRLGGRESRPGGQRAAAQCAVSPQACPSRLGARHGPDVPPWRAPGGARPEGQGRQTQDGPVPGGHPRERESEQQACDGRRETTELHRVRTLRNTIKGTPGLESHRATGVERSRTGVRCGVRR